MVLILARPPATEREERENVIIVNVAKQRNGPTGRFELLFRTNIQRFENLAPGRMDEHVPPEASFTAPPPDFGEPIMDAPYSEPEEEEEPEEIPFD